MSSSRRWQIFVFVWLAAVSAGSLRAQSYTKVVVFGDSLSDTGNLASQTNGQFGISYPGTSFNYTAGRFTDGIETTPAAKAYSGLWLDSLAKQFAAKPAVKNSLEGGTNYAFSKASTADGFQTVTVGAGLSVSIPNMGQQVTEYLATNPAPDAATLYVLFGGMSDLYSDSSSTGVSAAAQREAALAQRLVDVGATNFLVPNLPPLGAAPGPSGAASPATLNAASSMFRTLLAADLQTVISNATAAGKTVHIFQPDLYAQYVALAANPMSYGLANVTAGAQGTAAVNPDTYLYWDQLHPTTTGHHFIAAAAENVLSPLAASTTVLTVSPGATAATLTAVVTGSGPSAKATGPVTFFSGEGANATVIGAASLDATATAAIAFSGVAANSPYSVTAVYGGDLAYLNSTSAAQSLVVGTAASVSVAFSPSSLTLSPGNSATTTVTLTPVGGATGTVTLSCGALPAHASCAFSPAATTVRGATASTVTLTIGTSMTASRMAPRKSEWPTEPATGLAVCVLPVFGMGALRRRRSGAWRSLLAGLLMLGALGHSGCGGSGSTGAPGTVAPGTYTVVVTSAVTGSNAVTSQGMLTVVVE